MTVGVKEFRTIENIVGPLIFVRGVSEIGFGEIAEITMPDGRTRRGRVL